jgi:NADPH-dependent curcumin reductase
MADAPNLRIVLRRRPIGLPTADDFTVEQTGVGEPGDGEVLVRTLLLSIDPAMRGWVNEDANYSEPVAVGDVMRSFGLGEVVQSRLPGYAPGDIIVGMPGWQRWATLTPSEIHRRVDRRLAPLSTALGVLGINGLTAYVGMMDIGRPKPGETVVVSTAAGAVGSIAGQLASFRKARVVGLAGSPEKCRMCVEEFGFDACIDYRAVDDLRQALDDHCPDGVDVFFDNVGGEMLDAVLDQVNLGARVAICGTLSLPPGEAATGPRVERRLLVKRALMRGFLATDHLDRMDSIVAELAGYVGDGRLRYREEIAPKLTDAPAALERLLAGRNMGKSIVRVAEPGLADEEADGPALGLRC